MKNCLFPAALAALLLAGCGQSSSPSSSSPAQQPASAGPREIDLTGDNTMHYNTNLIEVKPGEQVTVVLTNTGTMPAEVMSHDWVLLKKDADAAAFSVAGVTHKDTDYVAPELKDEILQRIPLLGPRKSGQVTFTAPTEPGDYPYLCSFPAHYQAGMHGILRVQ